MTQKAFRRLAEDYERVVSTLSLADRATIMTYVTAIETVLGERTKMLEEICHTVAPLRW